MTRLIFLTFFGNERFRDDVVPAVVSGGSDDDDAGDGDGDIEAVLGYDPDFLPTVVYGEPPRPPRLHGHEPHESPWLMVLPITVLSLLSIVGGLLDLPLHHLEWLDSWLAPVFRGVHQPAPHSFVGASELTLIAFVAAIAGVLVGLVLYRRGIPTPAADPLPERLGPAAEVLGHGYYYDDGISAAVDGPVRTTGDFLDRDVDTGVIDGTVNGVAHLVGQAATALRHLQDGYVRRYAIGIALGAAAILLFFVAYAGR
jgi:NADH-quinone oxidoreductase subunit L